MKNEDLWNQYMEYTQDLTANCRKLAFAAAALCWFFKTKDHQFPSLILKALAFTVAFFLANILQYFLAALFLRFWTRRQEKAKWKQNQTLEGEYDKPAWLDYPAFTMWWAKIILLLLAYGSIGLYLVHQWPNA